MSKLLQKFIAASNPGKSLSKPELQKVAKELEVEFEKDNNKTTLATLINADLKEKAGASSENTESTDTDGGDEGSEETQENEAGEEEAEAKPPTKLEEAVATTERIASQSAGLKSAHVLSQALNDAGIKHEMLPAPNPRQVAVNVTVGKNTVRVPEEGNFTVDL